MTTDICNAYNHSASAAKGHAPVLSRLSTAAKVSAQWLMLAYGVHLQRRHLRGLSDRQLRDIGLERLEAEREASRAFWGLPTP